MLRSLFIRLSASETSRKLVTGFPPSRQMARRFVAGETIDEAIAVAKELGRQGIKSILNHVGESVTTREEVTHAVRDIHRLIERIAAEGVDASVSLKPSHVGLGFGPDFYYEQVRGIAEKSRQHHVFTELDIEGSADVAATLDSYHRLLDDFGGGIRQAVQSYLYRTPADVERIAGRGGSIRLVKGAYQEPPHLAIQDKTGINQATRQIIAMFLSPPALNSGAYLALGSHDPELIETTLRLAKARQVGADKFEFQMLLGVRRDEQVRLAELGYQVRVYIPYGEEWYPYFMRRLAERPANVLFIGRAIVGK